jgi:hypothetical protein
VLLGSLKVGREEVRINHAIFERDGEAQPPTMDIRRWWFDDNDDAQPGKGLNIPKAKWDEFVTLVNEADSKLKELTEKAKELRAQREAEKASKSSSTEAVMSLEDVD